jgi:uncharacterized membrane protein
MNRTTTVWEDIMKNKSLYIASAVVTAASFASINNAAAKYDAEMKHCYGAALAGQNDCKAGAHSCKGNATESCSENDWKMAMSNEECDAMVKKCEAKK